MTSPFVSTSAIRADDRQYLNGLSAPEATCSTNSHLSLRDTHSDRQQHLHTSAKEYSNAAADRFSYGSSSALTTSYCVGTTFGTDFLENSLKSIKIGYMSDRECNAQFSQYDAVRDSVAHCKKPEPGTYCDGIARNDRKNEEMPDAAKTQRKAVQEGSNILDFALDRTLEDWYARIMNIGSDVPLDKLAQMLLDTPDGSMMSKRNESQMNSTFEPLGYSIIDKDERSYYARKLKNRDVTLEGNEPSDVSWRISPEDSISLFQSHVMNRTTNRANRFSAEKEGDDRESLLDGTTDLMDRLKAFSSDLSGCDMADMLLPPPNGKSTKERLAHDSSDFSNVPNISDITNLIKAGLSSDELINELLDSRKSYPRSPSNTSAWHKETIPVTDYAGEKANITVSSDDSFVPMSYSIIDQDEESILKKYQMANDITLNGIENSNISWQLNPGEISLFKDHKSVSSTSTSFLRYGENNLLEENTRRKP